MSTPRLSTDDLRRIGAERTGPQPCPACGGLRCPGWEALPGGFDAGVLEQVGTLRDPDVYEPTVEEFHPAGTSTWSPDAPIAPAFHPYNKSEVWRCKTCHRAFLRYTEYGGYYHEQRIRELQPQLVVDAPAPE
jgi:hypothetical protein